MSSPRHKLVRILASVFIFLLACSPPASAPRIVSETGIETIERANFTILGQISVLTPGSTGTFLLQVRDANTSNLLRDSRVNVYLADPESDRTQRVFSGLTNSQGTTQVTFTVPDNITNPNQRLIIEPISTTGRSRTYEENVYIGRAYNTLVSTDKPVYQPGQTIHIRALTLDMLALKAADAQELTIIVADPSGNKLARETLTTSQYGIASLDFAIDALAASGDYIITAEIGPTTSSRTVEVKPYTLPRFKVEFDSDNSFYLPGDTATGIIDANYFFGKPVAEGTVTIRGYATDVERFQVLEVTGATDANGQFEYSFEIPDYFVGQLDNNAAEVDLEITVVDTANHAESIDETITVAEKPLLIEAIPESGTLRAGLKNIIYVDATYPDGRAAPSIIYVESPQLTAPITLTTDLYGLTSFTLTPEAYVATVLTLTAVTTPTHAADTPNTATQVLTLSEDISSRSILLRPERAEYHIGDIMNLDMYVQGETDTVILNVIKGQQSFATASLPIKGGMAQAAIEIDGSLLGSLELNAYIVNEDGEILRDRRFVLVNPAPATVEISSDAQTYRPGSTAKLDIQVMRDGEPMTGVVGVSIVDESVFSLGAQDPSFARTYFLLERELLESRYEIRGFSDLGSDESSPYDSVRDSVRYGAKTPKQTPEIAAARNTALMGLFAHELNLAQKPTTSATATTTVTDLAVDATTAQLLGWLNRIALMAPLFGIALYDGTKSRRRLLIGFVLFTLLAFFYTACAAAAPGSVPGAAAPAASESTGTETTATRGEARSTRLRQYFPETLYWTPELETDAEGRAQIEFPIADSITTWRVSVIASDQAGNLGSGQSSLRVFQDFFVEPDLPRFLTVDDEIDVPVALYNYLDTPQTIELTVKSAPWFELRGEQTQTVELGPNEVSAAYVPIRVLDFGTHKFEITANGEEASDAIVRAVDILPNGRPQAKAINGWLEEAHSINVSIPQSALPGTGRVTVKLYPGIVSQAIDGLAGMLQAPYGCFEQTTSVNYPNVLVLDYLRSTNQENAEIEAMAKNYIHAGYQRLVTFEVGGNPGGFSLYGDPPPSTMLTAYGLMQFTDMQRVHYIDPDLLDRTTQFLLDRQQENGSWNAPGSVGSNLTHSTNYNTVATTAYMIWVLSDAGHADQSAINRALAYLTENLDIKDTDSYILAVAANAYIAAGQPNTTILDELADRAIVEENNSRRWSSTIKTWLRASGPSVELETTAMATIAFLRSEKHLDLAEQALRYITAQRDYFGGYGNTQTTVMALKALLLAAEIGGEGGIATVTISMDGEREQTITIDESNDDVVQQITFENIGSEPRELFISTDGERAIQYQVVTEYYQPWPRTSSTPSATSTPQTPQGVRIDVSYDRTELSVNDIVQVTAEVEMLSEGTAGTLIVDVGIPPGFTPLTNDLDALMNSGSIERYELTGRQIIFYLSDVPSGQVYELNYRLQARFPIRAQAPASSVYDYYTPEQRATEAPQRITVNLGTPQQ